MNGIQLEVLLVRIMNRIQVKILLVLFVFIQSFQVMGQVELEDMYAVKVTINIQTTVPTESDKDPAPVYKENKRISGTVIGRAMMNNIEKIATDKDSWGQMGRIGSVKVFTAHSNLRLRDKEDYSKISYESKYPIRVGLDRTEMDYVMKDNEEKYIKISEFKAEGLNEVEAISLSIQPYHPQNAFAPIEPHYVVLLAISRYVGHMSATPVGNGHSLEWDYEEGKLVETDNPLNISVIGTLTLDDPPQDWDPVLVSASDFNEFFMAGGKGSMELDLIGSSFEKENSNRLRKINVILEFTKIPNLLAMPIVIESAPPLEDW